MDNKSALPRALSLDALRGLAILAMVLSGSLPILHNALPAWMYHAQFPPPEHAFRPEIIGITWVDVVFPMFLFSLGAAVPLALWGRMHAGASRWRLAWGACLRGVLLLFFSLYIGHLWPARLTEVYGSAGNLIGIGAFLILFLIFTRFPAKWPGWVRFFLRLMGWAAAIALLSVMRYPDGAGFSVHRHDIILAILANVVVTTGLVWLAWPQRVMARVLLMALVTALVVARDFTAWAVPVTELHWLKNLAGERIYNGVFWAVNPMYQQYLLITIPGTIAGDILLTWLRPAAQRLSFSIQNSRWRSLSLVQCLCLGIVCAALPVGVIVGLTLNDWPATCLMAAVLCGLGLLLVYSSPVRRSLRFTAALRTRPQIPALMFQNMFLWGTIWVGIGLALYYYQGGIKKDPATLSYFFVTAGLASFLLIVFTLLTDALHRPGSLFILVDNGQNPMIAYVAGSMFLIPILQILPVAGGLSALEWLTAQTTAPWPAFGRAAGLTLLVALIVCALTRARITWRT